MQTEPPNSDGACNKNQHELPPLSRGQRIGPAQLPEFDLARLTKHARWLGPGGCLCAGPSGIFEATRSALRMSLMGRDVELGASKTAIQAVQGRTAAIGVIRELEVAATSGYR